MATLVYSCSPKSLNMRRGRPKGARNKTSESIRWGFVEAYRLLGGVEGLVKWGKKEPNLFYPMLKALLPSELAESGAGQSIRILVYAPRQSPSDKSVVLADSASMQLIEAAEQAEANTAKEHD